MNHDPSQKSQEENATFEDGWMDKPSKHPSYRRNFVRV